MDKPQNFVFCSISVDFLFHSKGEETILNLENFTLILYRYPKYGLVSQDSRFGCLLIVYDFVHMIM